MKDTEFHQLVDIQMTKVEEAIDASEADIDYDVSGNVMTLEFDDRSQIIINRQEPMKEIWLASKSGGYHFQLKDDQWICSKTGAEFFELVKTECEKHAGEEINWPE
ncbi:MAG: iron donor protein CyaY [Vibrio sp.]